MPELPEAPEVRCLKSAHRSIVETVSLLDRTRKQKEEENGGRMALGRQHGTIDVTSCPSSVSSLLFLTRRAATVELVFVKELCLTSQALVL